ncbi:MAG: HAD family phosphatase [bacterium]
MDPSTCGKVSRRMERLVDRCDAFLFDMDGVLTDSMPWHFEAWRRVLVDLGITVSRDAILRREGEKGLFTLRSLLAERGRELPEGVLLEILSRKEQIFRSLSFPKLFPGAQELVFDLRAADKRLALVTGTSASEVETNLPRDLVRCFDVVVTGDRVQKGKPDAEPYRVALQGLGTAREASMVIENAPYGIQSAKAAGLRCVALATSLPARFLEGADHVVQGIHELRSLLFGAGVPGPA